MLKCVPSNVCSLCQEPLGSIKVQDEEHAFCCHGCKTVYTILEEKKELDQGHHHPIFQQALDSGLISNPSLIDQFKQSNKQTQHLESKRLYLEIGNMWCPACAEVIKLFLMREKGLKHIIIDYTTDFASITYHPQCISKDKIISILTKIGYEVRDMEKEERPKKNKVFIFRSLLAVFCSANIMMFSYPLYVGYLSREIIQEANVFVWLSFGLAVPVVTYCAYPIWKRLVVGLKVGIIGMEALVFLGVSSACVLSVYQLLQGSTHVYFDSMSMVVTLVLLGKWMERKAKFSAKSALLTLHRTLPKKGRRKVKEKEVFIPIKLFKKGDILVVKQGEKIVLDGKVVQGCASVDESIMTGESKPVDKQMGDAVLSGCMLMQGYLHIAITQKAEQSTLMRLFNLVEQSLEKKIPVHRTVDRIIRGFVPAIVVIAFVTFIICLLFSIQDGQFSVIATALHRVACIFLIACPCAIGIATPIAEALLMKSLAEKGVIIRNRDVLALLGKEKNWFFDKTGTLTQGVFQVKKGLEVLSEKHKHILSALSYPSIHPIARSINKEVFRQDQRCSMQVQEFMGKGMQGYFEGKTYFLGNEKLLNHIKLSPLHSFDTTVFFAEGNKVITSLLLGDKLRPFIQEAVFALKANGNHISVLSGDGEACVKHISQQISADKFYYRASPENKKTLIKTLVNKGEISVMVGDGMNDAPALTAASYGVSMLDATDLSIQVSDVLLTTSDLRVLPFLQQLGIKGRHIVKQNLFWAFFYNVLGVGCAVFGVLIPLMAAIAMLLSSFMVIGNTLRIKRISKKLSSFFLHYKEKV